MDGVVPPASLGGPIDIGPSNTYIAAFLAEDGFYVFSFGESVLFNREGRVLRRVETPIASRSAQVVFDGTHFYRFGGSPQVLDLTLEEVEVLDRRPCRPNQPRVYAPNGVYLCNGPRLATYNLRTNERLEAGPEEYQTPFRILPGGTDELYVVQSGFELLLLRPSDTGAPVVLGARELIVDPDNLAYWFQRTRAVFQDGDEVVGHFGERYDISSPQCLEAGDCFTEVSAREDRIYDFAAPGTDGSILLAPDHQGGRTLREARENPQPCGRCRFERWAAGDTGERESVAIGLPPFRYNLRYDTPRLADHVLLDDPWAGGAWILVEEVQQDPRPFVYPRLELYRVPV